MMRVTYQSRAYRSEDVRARYVRISSDGSRFQWCEVGTDRWYDMRQGECDESDVPEDVRDKCRALQGQAFAYVAMPSWPALERLA